jgi:hypothetical protein
VESGRKSKQTVAVHTARQTSAGNWGIIERGKIRQEMNKERGEEKRGGWDREEVKDRKRRKEEAKQRKKEKKADLAGE